MGGWVGEWVRRRLLGGGVLDRPAGGWGCSPLDGCLMGSCAAACCHTAAAPPPLPASPQLQYPALSEPPPTPHLPNCSEYAKSMVVGTQAPKELGTLRGADGAEGLKDKQ